MTTTAPDRQPATPGDLREDIAYLVFRALDIATTSRAAALEVADQILARLDAAPTTYSMPAEPPETVTELWDRNGDRWLRRPPHPVYGQWVPDDDPDSCGEHWPTLLYDHGPLSTVPPERAEADDA